MPPQIQNQGFILITVIILLSVLLILVMDNLHNAALQLKIVHHQLKKSTISSSD